MATIDDAIELVTSRKYAAMGRTTDDPVSMRPGAIIRALIDMGAEDEIEARALLAEAAEGLGGRISIVQHQGGNRAGGPVVRDHLELWMPRHQLHD